MREKKKGRGRYGLNRYFLVWLVFSVLGWAFEVGVMYLEGYGFVNRGFLSFPVCPIYGTAIVGAYLLFGTLAEQRGVLKGIKRRWLFCFLYVIFIFALPTVIEFVSGWIFDDWLGVSLWSYRHYPYHFGDYVCLPASIGWGIGLFLCLQLLFVPIKKGIGKLPNVVCWALAIFFGAVLGGEFVQKVWQALQKSGFYEKFR
ncbi:MAG: putative ABC transporter permease [Clostridia bacterium]|nr:putative ABC transporter permease [Clostridia bacterium]